MNTRVKGCIGIVAVLVMWSVCMGQAVGPMASYSVSGNRALFDCGGSQRVRLTVCTADMFEVEFDADGDFAGTPDNGDPWGVDANRDGGRDALLYRVFQDFAHKSWEGAPFTHGDEGQYVRVQTSEITARVYKNPFRIRYYDGSNSRLITGETDGMGMSIADDDLTRLRLSTTSDQNFFGWTLLRPAHSSSPTDAGVINKTGKLMKDNVEGMNTSNPWVYSTAGWGVFTILRWDRAALDTRNHSEYIDIQGDCGNYLCYYFMYGPSWHKVIGSYTSVVGRHPRMSKKFYGVTRFWWDIMNFYWPCETWDGSDWNNTWDDWHKLVDNHRQGGFPCDMLIGDAINKWPTPNSRQALPWGLAGRPVGSTDQTCPQEYVDFLGHCKDNGMIFGANIASEDGVGFGGGDARAINLRDPLEVKTAVDRGFDVAWYDWSYLSYAGFKKAHNSWLAAHDNDTSKVYVIHGWVDYLRNGMSSPAFGGDFLSAGTLYPIRGQLETSLGGILYDNTGLGSGFDWNIIATALKPSITHHRSNGSGGYAGHPWGSVCNLNGQPAPYAGDPRPWMHPADIQDVYRTWQGFHYRMIPYLFSYGVDGYYTGVPVWRHMMTMEPDNSATYEMEDQAYVGDWLIVAPYITDGINEGNGVRTNIYLPQGTWYDFFLGTKYTGPTTISSYPCDPTGRKQDKRLPLFVKEGAIIPMMPSMLYVGEKPEDPLTLRVWPGATNSSFTLYEDETPVATRFTCSSTGQSVRLDIPPFGGARYSGSSRKYIVEMYTDRRPSQVRRGGSVLPQLPDATSWESAVEGWYYDNTRGGTCFIKPNGSAPSGFGVEVDLTDTEPPSIVSVTAAGLDTVLTVSFSEKVDAVTATNVGNYAIPGLTITKANLTSEGQSVVLTVTPALVENAGYALTAQGIADVSPASNAMTSSTVNFTYSKYRNGLRYTYYANTSSTAALATVNALTPTQTGIASTISTAVSGSSENYTLKFEGYVDIPATGNYTFHLNSDDGSMLYVNGALVVNNDGMHAVQERSGSVELTAAKQPIVVTYTQGTGGAELSMSWQGPGIAKQAVPAQSLYYEPMAGDPVGGARRKTPSNIPSVFSLKQGAAARMIVGIPGRPGMLREVTIRLYDMHGRLVRSLLDGRLRPGYHVIGLKSTMGRSQTLPVGRYVCRMVSGRFDKAVPVALSPL